MLNNSAAVRNGIKSFLNKIYKFSDKTLILKRKKKSRPKSTYYKYFVSIFKFNNNECPRLVINASLEIINLSYAYIK